MVSRTRRLFVGAIPALVAVFPIAFIQTALARTVSFPSIPNLPQNPRLSFGGYFKRHQPVKIVFAIGQPGGQTTESLVNGALVIKYLVSKGYKYKIHYVFYSKGVLVADRFNQRYSASWAPLLGALHRSGVTFTVCHNAMALLHVRSDDLYPYMKPIPAGILSLVEYEARGYQPIFNPNSVTGRKFLHVK
jgi:intracellular sulfur oxidation DsrE/DsrF family protein